MAYCNALGNFVIGREHSQCTYMRTLFHVEKELLQRVSKLHLVFNIPFLPLFHVLLFSIRLCETTLFVSDSNYSSVLDVAFLFPGETQFPPHVPYRFSGNEKFERKA